MSIFISVTSHSDPRHFLSVKLCHNYWINGKCNYSKWLVHFFLKPYQERDSRRTSISKQFGWLVDCIICGALVWSAEVSGRSKSSFKTTGLHSPVGLHFCQHETSLPGLWRKTHSNLQGGGCMVTWRFSEPFTFHCLIPGFPEILLCSSYNALPDWMRIISVQRIVLDVWSLWILCQEF